MHTSEEGMASDKGCKPRIRWAVQAGERHAQNPAARKVFHRDFRSILLFMQSHSNHILQQFIVGLPCAEDRDRVNLPHDPDIVQWRQTRLFNPAVSVFPGDGQGCKQHYLWPFIGWRCLHRKRGAIAVIGCKML